MIISLLPMGSHVAFIPFLVDTVGFIRARPITIHAIQGTLDILQEHLFNWHLWPDFTKIPDDSLSYMRYEVLSLGNTINLSGRKIKSLPANHVVPAVGYQLDSGQSSLVFTGDRLLMMRCGLSSTRLRT